MLSSLVSTFLSCEKLMNGWNQSWLTCVESEKWTSTLPSIRHQLCHQLRHQLCHQHHHQLWHQHRHQLRHQHRHQLCHPHRHQLCHQLCHQHRHQLCHQLWYQLCHQLCHQLCLFFEASSLDPIKMTKFWLNFDQKIFTPMNINVRTWPTDYTNER